MGPLGATGQSLTYRDVEVVFVWPLLGPAVEHSAGLWVGERHGRAQGWSCILPVRGFCWAEEEGNVCLAIPRAAPG